MRTDNLNRHMKMHNKPVEVEPLPSITSTTIPPVSGSSDSFYKPTSMDEEELLKKMLKGDREYKEKMEIEYDIGSRTPNFKCKKNHYLQPLEV